MRYKGRKVFEINVCKKKILSCRCCKKHDDCYDKDQIKIWLLFSISLTFILEFFCDRCESFEIFSNCAVKQKLCRYKPCFILPSKHINRAMRAPALFRYFIKLHNFPLLDENCFY